MPELSGAALADAVHAIRPNVPVVFMSGYTRGMRGPQPGTEGNHRLLQKPFSERALLTEVADALAAEPGPGAG
jgi:two-component system cell cycle sensor histidine kinase/response regulator CckA